MWQQAERLVNSKFRGLYYHYGPSQCAAHGVTLDDLYQEGWFAFLAAVRAYKPGGWKFNTYLHYACKNRFRAAMGTDRPCPLNMADSLDQPITGENKSGKIGGLLPDEQAAVDMERVQERQAGQTIVCALQSGLKALPPLQAQIVRCRSYAQLTRPQTAQRLSLAPEQVRREESRALRSLCLNQEIRAASWMLYS